MSGTQRRIPNRCCDVMIGRFNDVKWLPLFILILVSLFAARLNAAEDSLDAMLDIFKSDGVDDWNQLDEKTQLAWFKRYYCDLDSGNRRFAAFRLADWKCGERDAMLDELLADNDLLVRYAAAKAKFGVKAGNSENVKRFSIQDVVQAMLTIQKPIEALSTGSLKDKFAATQDLIKIGRPALPGLSSANQSDQTVQLSLLYAVQEIEAAYVNVQPKWADEIQNKLKREVSFEFKEVPLADAIKHVAKSTEIDIKFHEFVTRGGFEKTPVSLRVKDMKASVALEWIVKLTDMEFVFQEKTIQINRQPNIACGPEYIIVDVRDLEAAGVPAIAWKELLPRDVQGVVFDAVIGSGYFASHGFLVLVTPMSGAGYGRVWTRPIVEYLNSVRKTLDLKPVEWKINGK